MKILITGGTGAVGKAATKNLVELGHEVRVIGRTPGHRIENADYQVCDIASIEDLRKVLRGFDAIVHLAAIAEPAADSGHDVMQANVMGTFNVFEAAAAEGINRIVQASSINALGYFWGLVDVDVKYFPIDEVHPSYTTDAYSLSKTMIEEIGNYFWRREGITSVALRIPHVYDRKHYDNGELLDSIKKNHELFDGLMARPEPERTALVADLRKRTLDTRSKRPMEYPAAQSEFGKIWTTDDRLWSSYMFDRFNLWAWLDERDSAQAIAKGLTAQYEGSHVLFINDDRNCIGYDTETLTRLYFPQVTQWKTPPKGCSSLVSIDKARELLGFEPEYSVKSLIG